jgi:hypothetical protein
MLSGDLRDIRTDDREISGFQLENIRAPARRDRSSTPRVRIWTKAS